MKSLSIAVLVFVACLGMQALAAEASSESCYVTHVNTDLFEGAINETDRFIISNGDVSVGDAAWTQVVKKPKPCAKCLSEYIVGEEAARNNPHPATYVFRKYKERIGADFQVKGAFFAGNDLKYSLLDLSCD